MLLCDQTELCLPDLLNTKIIPDDLCITGGSKVQMRILAYKTAMQDILKRLCKHFKAGQR